MAEREKLQKYIESRFALNESIIEKCNAQKEALAVKQNRFLDNLQKLMQNKTMNENTKKTRFQTSALQLQKSIEKRNLIDCQLRNCYKETHQMIKDYVDVFMIAKKVGRADKRVTKYYAELLKKDRITTQDLLNVEHVKNNAPM